MISDDKLGEFYTWEQLLFSEGPGEGITDAYLKADKVIISDCDGILTDGGHYYTKDGKYSKRFGSCDKEALRFMLKCRWRFLFVTDDPSGDVITQRRLQDWRVFENDFGSIVNVCDGENCEDLFNLREDYLILSKNAPSCWFLKDVSPIDRSTLVRAFKKKDMYTVFVGDSLSDLYAGNYADLFCTVDNAGDIVKENANIVSKKMGGFGGFADIMYKIHFTAGNAISYTESLKAKTDIPTILSPGHLGDKSNYQAIKL